MHLGTSRITEVRGFEHRMTPAQGARDVAMRIKWLARHAAARRQRAAAEAAEADRKQGRARGQSIFATPAPRSSSGPSSGPVIAEVPIPPSLSGLPPTHPRSTVRLRRLRAPQRLHASQQDVAIPHLI
jgi:hypothetical protein